jgi:hypothetical protein
VISPQSRFHHRDRESRSGQEDLARNPSPVRLSVPYLAAVRKVAGEIVGFLKNRYRDFFTTESAQSTESGTIERVRISDPPNPSLPTFVLSALSVVKIRIRILGIGRTAWVAGQPAQCPPGEGLLGAGRLAYALGDLGQPHGVGVVHFAQIHHGDIGATPIDFLAREAHQTCIGLRKHAQGQP